MNHFEPIVDKARAERRVLPRVRVDLPGRVFFPVEGREALCTVVDLSPVGTRLQCDEGPEPETQVILYLGPFGRFEGRVTRCDSHSFGVRFVCTAMKRERIAEQLTLFVKDELVVGQMLRRHDRTLTKGITHFTCADGQLVACKVLDLSVSGVSLITNKRLPIGEFVLIGEMAGCVVRHHDQGIGIEFVGQSERAAPEWTAAKVALAS